MFKPITETTWDKVDPFEIQRQIASVGGYVSIPYVIQMEDYMICLAVKKQIQRIFVLRDLYQYTTLDQVEFDPLIDKVQ